VKRDGTRAAAGARGLAQRDQPHASAFIPFTYEKMVPPMTLAQYRQWAALRI